jgi:hypothetical protein
MPVKWMAEVLLNVVKKTKQYKMFDALKYYI